MVKGHHFRRLVFLASSHVTYHVICRPPPHHPKKKERPGLYLSVPPPFTRLWLPQSLVLVRWRYASSACGQNLLGSLQSQRGVAVSILYTIWSTGDNVSSLIGSTCLLQQTPRRFGDHMLCMRGVMCPPATRRICLPRRPAATESSWILLSTCPSLLYCGVIKPGHIPFVWMCA